MNSNRMLTLALYLLLGGLVAVFGYRACQLKQKQAAAQAEQAEMEQTLRDMGYEGSRADESGVAKPSDLSDTKTAAPVATAAKTDGAAPASTSPAPAVSTTTGTSAKSAPAPVTHSTESSKPAATKIVDRNSETVDAKPTAVKKVAAPTKSLTAKGATATAAKKSVAPAKPAFAVVAASFSKKEGARKVMESLIKKGFTEAEVAAKGKYWVVISGRASTREAADKMVEQVNKQPDCAKAYVWKK